MPLSVQLSVEIEIPNHTCCMAVYDDINILPDADVEAITTNLPTNVCPLPSPHNPDIALP